MTSMSITKTWKGFANPYMEIVSFSHSYSFVMFMKGIPNHHYLSFLKNLVPLQIPSSKFLWDLEIPYLWPKKEKGKSLTQTQPKIKQDSMVDWFQVNPVALAHQLWDQILCGISLFIILFLLADAL